MKVDQFFEEHNFHVYGHLKFWRENGEKQGQPTIALVHRDRATFKV
jgi:hypothetical protein